MKLKPPPLKNAGTGGGPTWLAPLQARWQSLAPRERRGVALAGLAVGVLLLWAVGVSPALRTLRQAQEQRPGVETQLARMQALAKEAQELRALPQVSAEQARIALQSSTQRLGAKARLQNMGDTVQVNLDGVPPEAFTAWLSELRSAARSRVTDAQLQMRDGALFGTVIVAPALSS